MLYDLFQQIHRFFVPAQIKGQQLGIARRKAQAIGGGLGLSQKGLIGLGQDRHGIALAAGFRPEEMGADPKFLGLGLQAHEGPRCLLPYIIQHR